ncbi:Ras-related protein Rab-7b [Tritrichomonas foetus]|uniref:Ras-related protein Rab-7b n=1 Tax=Tritrichomonas foetus TaxID=1144522 RepID=A0A1J4KJW1_9EUKA|nr:Ras-related protein Rab-7b [Tritrichomonas foetus]|eukprot:OHT11232.1 Ras-related protein Rab-7b [Tritrichomonas foetus]
MASRGRQMLKLLLLGDAGVGKTSLLNQFVNREFTAQYKATIGSDFSSKQLDIDGKFVTLQIWDTAGQERFQSLGPTFYRGTDCCILVYDVTKPTSFENIKKWRNEFSMQLGLSNADDFAFLLLGNKSDLPEKAVQPSAAREFAQMNGDMLFFEVSAKTADNVQTSFEAIVRRALEKAPKDDFQIPSSVVKLENQQDTKKGCSC